MKSKKLWSKKHQDALYELLDMYKNPKKYAKSDMWNPCPLCTSVHNSCNICSWSIMTEDTCYGTEIVDISCKIRHGIFCYTPTNRRIIQSRIRQIKRWIKKWYEA